MEGSQACTPISMKGQPTIPPSKMEESTYPVSLLQPHVNEWDSTINSGGNPIENNGRVSCLHPTSKKKHPLDDNGGVSRLHAASMKVHATINDGGNPPSMMEVVPHVPKQGCHAYTPPSMKGQPYIGHGRVSHLNPHP